MGDFNAKKIAIDKLDNIVNKYKHKYDSTIKRKPTDVKDTTYFGYTSLDVCY